MVRRPIVITEPVTVEPPTITGALTTYISKSIYLNNDTVAKVIISAKTFLDGGCSQCWYISANGGSNWEVVTTVTSGTSFSATKTITNTGQDLRYKVEFTGDVGDTNYFYEVKIKY